MQAYLLREHGHDEQGTYGDFEIERGAERLDLHSLELPWEDKDHDGIGDRKESRINPGVYLCRWHESPKFGWCYELLNVPGRDNILIHPANFAGDDDVDFASDKVYRKQLLGCIGLGMERGVLEGQKAILRSREAIKKFHEFTKGEDFYLTVEDA